MNRQEQVEAAADALMEGIWASALNLRRVEAKAIAETVLNAADPGTLHYSDPVLEPQGHTAASEGRPPSASQKPPNLYDRF